MTEAEVRRLVRQQVDCIRASESGVLPPTPYVVMEVINRLKTVRPWEGLSPKDHLGPHLRRLVEETVQGKSVITFEPEKTKRRVSPEGGDFEVVQPLKEALRGGAKKTRHLRDITVAV